MLCALPAQEQRDKSIVYVESFNFHCGCSSLLYYSSIFSIAYIKKVVNTKQ